VKALLLLAALAQAVATGPQTPEERGLWMEMNEAERELKDSNFVVHDAALQAYVEGVLCRTVGTARCAQARVYLVRTPYFNANMAPNGMMQVWTGLLLRARNEAQLAAVLAHEFAHFEGRHSLIQFRDARAKTDAMAWLSFLPMGVGAIGSVGLAGGMFANSREMERAADLASIGYLRSAGYAPGEAARIWEGLRAEQDATAAARGRKSRKDRNGGFFATHPNSGDRAAYLTQAAAGAGGDDGAAAYRAAIAPWWARLIDDQVKLNDPGATNFLLGNLAGDGWTAALLYARGELYRAWGRPGDLEQAVYFYREAIAAGVVPAEAHRGLGLALTRIGDEAEARAALGDYLRLKPDAGDRAIIAAIIAS
jgi:beta-barrel assembly-enhancing protease